LNFFFFYFASFENGFDFFFSPPAPFWIIRMDVPLAVAMESETFQQRKFESLHPTQCQVYWSDARRDAAVLD
jgi:hypothetical protein